MRDIAPVIEGKDGFKCLGARTRRGGFVKNGDGAADQIAAIRHLARGGQPVGCGHAITVQQENPIAAGFGQPPVARHRRTAIRFDDKAHAGMGLTCGVQRVVGIVVHDDDVSVGSDLWHQRIQTADQPVSVVVMGNDDGGVRIRCQGAVP